MNDEKKINPPKLFVNLHGHSDNSIGDGLNKPQEHIDFAISNGLDALALTDHGNMNGFSHQYIHSEKLRVKGVDFKPIHGVEAYFVDSLSDWQKLYDNERENKRQEKAEKNKDGLQEQLESYREDTVDLTVLKEDEDTKGNAGIENEEESKSNKWNNPLFQRNHLVLLAKNDVGLTTLFKMISKSFKDGFYRYPRMDFEMLKSCAKGNIIASTACISGTPGRIVFDNQLEPISFNNRDQKLVFDTNFDKIQNELKNLVEKFQDALGPENFYLELQYHYLPIQHLLNYHLIECSKRTGAPLIVTCDSHYAKPEYWREREIYKAMSQLQLLKKSPEEVLAKIPKNIDELKCELYPKNAEQLWDTYKKTTKPYDFYDDAIIREAILRTHSIAHDQIGNVVLDKKVKLPALNKIIEKNKLEKLLLEIKSDDEDTLAFEQLKKDVVIGAKWRKIDDKEEYIERLKHELSVIKQLKFSKYFLTYAKIMEIIGEKTLLGIARGSAGGSLLSYILNITQLDPIKYDLLFARFMTKFKTCLDPNMFVLTDVGSKKLIDLCINDKVKTHTGDFKTVKTKTETLHAETYKFVLENDDILESSPNHLWIIVRNGKKIETKAKYIKETDEFVEML